MGVASGGACGGEGGHMVHAANGSFVLPGMVCLYLSGGYGCGVRCAVSDGTQRAFTAVGEGVRS